MNTYQSYQREGECIAASPSPERESHLWVGDTRPYTGHPRYFWLP